MHSYVSSYRSPSNNVRLHNSKKKQHDEADNNLSTTVYSNGISKKMMYDGDTDINGAVALLTTCSNVPSSTLFTSEQQRSSL
jgi:hypothetical protein